MTKIRAMQMVAATLSTLAETKTGGPETHLMMGLDCNLMDWLTVRDVMTRNQWIQIDRTTGLVTLTEAGKKKGDTINDLLA